MCNVFLSTLQILEDIDKWGIDVYRIAELSNRKPLTTVTYAIFMVSLHMKQTTDTISIAAPGKAT